MANPLAKTKANNEPYRKVKITMWNDPSFRALSPLPPSGQSLFVYLLTGPFTGIIPGLFKAGRAALAEELGWDVEAFDLALGEALSLGMVKADTQARVFWLPNAAKHNPPTSVNVIKSWVRAFELLPECDLKYEALESLKASSHGVSKAMGLAFDKAFALANPLAKDKAKPLPRPFQKAVNSKQILKDKTPHSAQVREEDFLSGDEKFQMFDSWSPSGEPPQEYTPDELEDFVLFWSAGGQEFNQAQWEQKFTRSVQRYREHAKTKKSGGQHAKQSTTPASALEQVRARHNEWRISQGLAPLGDDGGDLRQPLGDQERRGAIHDLDPGDFEILG
ncbi:DnaT-like ssDNA-binding domain-containing protein [Serratia liquefaciens]|uniref:DnaT-like ssDNA-binding domain-containing protein n=1 Tax=Serratia liquefaciens TaxID=614 RepID=UPI003906760D